MAIPVSVIVVTKNEAGRIGRCLAALKDFDEVIVVDSQSTDATQALARESAAHFVDFIWNGQYPKKRQWCLDYLRLAHEWVFFVDADEIVTPELVAEIRALNFTAAGYFVRGRYIYDGKALRFGLCNNKLALIDRRKMEFPVVDDLDLPAMGEIEGHYQPVLKPGYEAEKIQQLKAPLLHYAYDNPQGWYERHERYAAWERGMNDRKAWPQDLRLAKRIFKQLPGQPWAAFFHSYVFKRGFLDGAAGFNFARSRYRYYRMISMPGKDLA